MIYAGIVAGGTGTRMGGDIPKQFLELKGEAILHRTVRTFAGIKEINAVYIAVHPDWIEYSGRLLADLNDCASIKLLPGGESRNESIQNIINVIAGDKDITEEDILITHDAVRPFVSEDIIRRNIISASNNCCCTTAIPATDTILYSPDGNDITSTLDRTKMFHAQTPQSFRIKAFLEAYEKLTDEQKLTLTDICGIFSAAGLPVSIVRGDVKNIKITSPFDLDISLAILK